MNLLACPSLTLGWVFAGKQPQCWNFLPPVPTPQQDFLVATSTDLQHLVTTLHCVCPSLDCLRVQTPGGDWDIAVIVSDNSSGEGQEGDSLGCLHYLRAFHGPDWLALQPLVLGACSGGLEQLGVHCRASSGGTEGFISTLSKALVLLPQLQLLRLHGAGRISHRYAVMPDFTIVLHDTMDLLGPLLRVLPPQLATLELVDCDMRVHSPLHGSQRIAVKHVGLVLQLHERQLWVGDMAGDDGRPVRVGTAEEVAALLCTVLGRGDGAPAGSEEATGSGGAGGSSGGSSFALHNVELRGMSLRLPSGEGSSVGLGAAASAGALGWIRDFARRTPVRLGRLLLQLPDAVDEEGLQGALQELQAFLLVLSGPVGCAVVSCTGEADVRHVVSVVTTLLDVGLEAEGRRPGKVEVRGCRREVWEEAVAGAAAGVGAGAAGVGALMVWGGVEAGDMS